MKRIITFQLIPLIFSPVMLILIGLVLWSMIQHRADMEMLIESRNVQETQFAIALLESQAELLSSKNSIELTRFLEDELAIIKNENTEQAILIVDRDRKVIYYSGTVHPASHLVSHPGVAEALAGESGALREAFPDATHLISYGPVENLGWAFIIEEFWDGGRLTRMNLLLLVPLLFVPLIFIFFLIMWSSNRWVLRPLAILNAYAQEVGSGNYEQNVPFVSGIKEINELHAELDRMVRKLDENQASLRHYATLVQSGQEDERKRLAQELHDDTIQALIHLDQLVQLSDISSEGHDSLRRQISLISSNLRAMIQDLRPSYLDELGLVPALEMLVKNLSQGREAVMLTFEHIGKIRRLSPDKELMLYRITQEALNNSLKHANPCKVEAILSFAPAAIRLNIKDDGSGISQGTLNNIEKHFGLRGMQERARSIGSEVTLTSRPGLTVVRVDLED